MRRAVLLIVLTSGQGTIGAMVYSARHTQERPLL